MDFRNDKQAVDQRYEYMFGKSFLVAPITRPNATDRKVYLPEKTDWFNFWTGQRLEGGQTINAEAPIDQIPLFVRSGSIVPMGETAQYAGENEADTLTIRVYKGADGSFKLYEDEGDNYNYESGEFSVIPFTYNEDNQILTIGDQKGTYPGSLKKRVFNIVVVRRGIGNGSTRAQRVKTVNYRRSKTEIKL